MPTKDSPQWAQFPRTTTAGHLQKGDVVRSADGVDRTVLRQHSSSSVLTGCYDAHVTYSDGTVEWFTHRDYSDTFPVTVVWHDAEFAGAPWMADIYGPRPTAAAPASRRAHRRPASTT